MAVSTPGLPGDAPKVRIKSWQDRQTDRKPINVVMWFCITLQGLRRQPFFPLLIFSHLTSPPFLRSHTVPPLWSLCLGAPPSPCGSPSLFPGGFFTVALGAFCCFLSSRTHTNIYTHFLVLSSSVSFIHCKTASLDILQRVRVSK